MEINLYTKPGHGDNVAALADLIRHANTTKTMHPSQPGRLDRRVDA